MIRLVGKLLSPKEEKVSLRKLKNLLFSATLRSLSSFSPIPTSSMTLPAQGFSLPYSVPRSFNIYIPIDMHICICISINTWWYGYICTYLYNDIMYRFLRRVGLIQ